MQKGLKIEVVKKMWVIRTAENLESFFSKNKGLVV